MAQAEMRVLLITWKLEEPFSVSAAFRCLQVKWKCVIYDHAPASLPPESRDGGVCPLWVTEPGVTCVAQQAAFAPAASRTCARDAAADADAPRPRGKLWLRAHLCVDVKVAFVIEVSLYLLADSRVLFHTHNTR